LSFPLIQYKVCDISEIKKREVEAVLQEAEKKYGPIEVVICCAATSKPAMFISSDFELFRNHMDVNFYGVLRFLQPIAKRMVLRRTQGRICLVGDPVASNNAVPGMAPYSCSKAALEQLAF